MEYRFNFETLLTEEDDQNKDQNQTKVKKVKKTLLDILLQVIQSKNDKLHTLLQLRKDSQYLNRIKDALDKPQETIKLKTPNSTFDLLLLLIQLAAAKTIEYKDTTLGGFRYRLAFGLAGLGALCVTTGFSMINAIKDELNKAKQEAYITEGSIALVLMRLVDRIHNMLFPVFKKPNLGAVGLLSLIASGLAFIDMGLAILPQDLYNQIFEGQHKLLQNNIRDFVNAVIKTVQNTKELSLLARPLIIIFRGLRWVFTKIKAGYHIIVNLLKREKKNEKEEKTTNESFILQESAVTSIFKTLIKLAGVGALLSIGVAFFLDVTNLKDKLNEIDENSLYAPVLKTLKSLYDTYDRLLEPFRKADESTNEG